MAWYFFAALTCLVGVLTFVAQRNRPLKAAHLLATQGSIWHATPRKTVVETPGDAAVAGGSDCLVGQANQQRRVPLDVRRVLRSRYAWHLGFVYMAFGFAYMIYFTFFQKRLTADLGLTSAAAGSYFLALGVASLACGFYGAPSPTGWGEGGPSPSTACCRAWPPPCSLGGRRRRA